MSPQTDINKHYRIARVAVTLILIRRNLGALIAALLLASPGLLHAQDLDVEKAVSLSLSATFDAVGAVSGDIQRGRSLSLIDATIDADLNTLVGWNGASLRVRGQVSSGQEPNADIGTLRGVDNIEVSRQRARLYEAWIDQAFLGERGSVRIGLYDINTEFYATDSSGLLIGSPYGIGSELAATGTGGPSVYPSTALALRVRMTEPGGLYWQGAVINAAARTLGDPGGVETDFDQGVLSILEAGWKAEAGTLSLGLWGYSREQDDLERAPIQHRSAGFYGLAEKPLGSMTLFLRGGVSDGRTGVFKASWQAGMLREPALARRPDSLLSVGLGQEVLSDPLRATSAAAGQPLTGTETALELAYSDQIGKGFSVQPGLQLIRHPGGVADRGTVAVLSLRLKFEH